MKQIAVVTGASSGIGLAISDTLCKLGYEVYGFGRDFSRQETGVLLEKHPGFHPLEGDLLETRDVLGRLQEIPDRQNIRVLVNNAGVGYYGLHEELNPIQIMELVRTNLELPMILTGQLLRTLKANHGYVINISSVTAEEINPHGCAYGATKAGLTSFGDSIFAENRKYGLKVTTIQPDMTVSRLYRNANFEQGEEPGSYLKPEQIAEAVAYVLTREEGVVIPKITLQPQLHRIRRK